MKRKKTVLIVDDSSLIRKILYDLLVDTFEVLEATDGLAALNVILDHRVELSLVILDLIMPKMDGLSVMEHMREAGLIEDLPIVVITSQELDEYIEKAYDLGASEVIHKPFSTNIVKKRILNIVQLFEQKKMMGEIISQQTRLLKMQEDKLRKTNHIIIDALSTVIEYRSLESGQHIRRIRGLTKILAKYIMECVPGYRIGQEEAEVISNASAMHDIGKIAIPDAILLKPGKLTAEEFEVMKTHTVKGCEILYHFNGIDDKQYLDYCNDICLYHHERWDGGGYPEGLRGNDIPISAQMVSIADVFDALTHKRIYKEAIPFDKAAEMIFNGRCGIFSPVLLEAFRKTLPQLKELCMVYGDDTF